MLRGTVGEQAERGGGELGRRRERGGRERGRRRGTRLGGSEPALEVRDLLLQLLDALLGTLQSLCKCVGQGEKKKTMSRCDEG